MIIYHTFIYDHQQLHLVRSTNTSTQTGYSNKVQGILEVGLCARTSIANTKGIIHSISELCLVAKDLISIHGKLNIT